MWLQLLMPVASIQTSFTVGVPVIGALVSILVPRILDRRKDRAKMKIDETTTEIAEKDLVARLQQQTLEGASKLLDDSNERAARAETRARIAEEERDKMRSAIEEVKAQVNVLTVHAREQDQAIALRDGQVAAVIAINLAKDEKIAALQQEIVQLRARVAELERAKGMPPTPTTNGSYHNDSQ